MLINDEFVRRDKVKDLIKDYFALINLNPDILLDCINTMDGVTPYRNVDELLYDIEHLKVNTRTNWDGCCPDPEYPEIEYVDITKEALLNLIKSHLFKDEINKNNKLEDTENGNKEV